MQKQNFSGLYQVTMDEKGRFSFPSKLMSQFMGERKGLHTLYITLGKDGNCLWLIPEEYWKQLTGRIKTNTSPFGSEGLALMRYFVGHAFEQDIEEKSRRLTMPHTLAKMVDITEKCNVVGMMNFCELWNPDRFQEQLKLDTENREKRTSELGGLVTF